jgi:hypothetical protein
MECFHCGKKGHIKQECNQLKPSSQTNSNYGKNDAKPKYQQSNQNNQKKSGACYNCGGTGHLARNCPSPKNEQKPSQNIPKTPKINWSKAYTAQDEQQQEQDMQQTPHVTDLSKVVAETVAATLKSMKDLNN